MQTVTYNLHSNYVYTKTQKECLGCKLHLDCCFSNTETGNVKEN